MTTLKQQLRIWVFFPLLFLTLSACTDKRTQEKKLPVQLGRLPPQVLEAVSDVRINGQDITAYQMTQKAGALYLTGVPFGFTKWDVLSDAEAPHPTFIAADDIDQFQPMGRWRPDWYASGGLAIQGPYAIMSGIVGSSFVSLNSTARPVETKRYPAIDPNNTQTPQDDNFIYRAVAAHPTQPLVYGMREQDYIVVSRVTSNGLQPIRTINYGSGPVCCVMGATVFANKLFVAMRGMLRVYTMAMDGSLSAPVDINLMQAVDVSSTDNLLYVQHAPTFAQAAGSVNAAGIYVFDANGDSQAFLPASPKRFAVGPDDGHLYANMDDTSVRIYRIQWTNR